MREDLAHSQRDEAIRPRELTAVRVKVALPEGEHLLSVDSAETAPPTAHALPVTASGSTPAFGPTPAFAARERPLAVPDPSRSQLQDRASDEDVMPSVPPVVEPVRTKGDSSPLLQSLMLLTSMVLMLLIARFTVPGIVEEIRYAWHRGELRAEYETGGEGLKNVSMDSLTRAYQMVTSAVGPSVVHIDVERSASETEKKMHQMLGGDAFSFSDQGSGVIVDSEGYLLTNRHVIADGQKIFVTLSDGRRLPARVIGSDSLTDLAVLKVDGPGLLPIQWGDSDSLRVGSPVWAIGSPFGLDRTVTFGILSGKHRWVRASERLGASGRYQDFMQSDVAVNPGNSGGPLVDARGTLVGINTAIVGDTYRGVSFSIPSNVSKQIYERIRKTGRVHRGYLGVSLVEVSDELLEGENTRVRGAMIAATAGIDSPATIAGLKAEDVVQQVDGVDVMDVGHLMRIVADAGGGAAVEMNVRRNGESLKITVVLGDRPVDLDP